MDELKALLQRLFKVRDVLLKVNLGYIESAAQDDRYRDKPPFRLQGSYRNMSRLAPQVTALMRDDELDALLRDHYRGEAQTLTTGAEENLLQLAELLGRPTTEETERWAQIRADFLRQRKLGGAEDDPSIRLTNGLLDIARGVEALAPQQALAERAAPLVADLARQLHEGLQQPLAGLATQMAAADSARSTQLAAQQEAWQQLRAPLQALGELAEQLRHGTTDSQQQMRASLDASTAALQALRESTLALDTHSDSAQEQRMVDALLSLSVTYRQLIMPLVRAVEKRLGMDAAHPEVAQIESALDALAPRQGGSQRPADE